MTATWYDLIDPEPIDGVTCLVRVERIYCFDWDQFGRDDRSALIEAYEGLPGAMGRPADACPAWFGDDQDLPPFLMAYEEPPGLQVCGVLPEADWLAWDERFRAATAALPARRIG